LTVCGIEIPEDDLRISAEDAKVLVGWASESEFLAQLTAGVSPEIACKMNVKYGTEYDLIDYYGEKVRCSNNTRNRPLNIEWVQQLAQDILNDIWRFNGESWVIGTTGVALSLQHRAIALIWAQQMVDYNGKDRKKKKLATQLQQRHTEPLFIEALVVRGVRETPDVIRTLDHVRTRSLRDVRVAINKIPKAAPEATDMFDSTVYDAASKLKVSASYLTWHKNNTPAPYENEFLKGLTYPLHGDYAEYPYPFYDTEIGVTAMTYTGNPWDEDGKSDDPFEVKGSLFIRPSPFGGLQCSVNTADENYDVDPESVKPLSTKGIKSEAPKNTKRGKRS